MLSFSCAIVVAVLSIASRAEAQDETISGNLTVEGRADLLMGPLSLGTSSFYDELDDETTAEGLTIHYSETSQVWSGGNFVQGRSTIVQRVGQELADFYWQTSEPDGLGGFAAVDLMKLSNEQLLVQPSILGQGTLNLLPNQTLSGGNGSILTLGLADNRYLSNAGGTIAGNLTVTGTATISSIGSNFTGTGTDNRLPNQVADHANSILTKGIADGLYLSSGSTAGISFKFGSETIATSEHSIVLGHHAKANTNAISIGSYASDMGGNMASGAQSVALGYVARAPGDGAIGIGTSSWAAGETSLSLGQDTGAYTD
ncbi:MAG: hypothetical protein OJI67_09465, partial [Prosthecobacter sp.]|nr:hypothetical protein [Prosthecobacter sp.]